MTSGHKNLKVWQRSMTLVTNIYSVTKLFPKQEIYGLTSQIRRAAVSIPSNLAEGYAMSTVTHYLRFVYLARGSLAELETQIMISADLNYIAKEQAVELLSETEELSRMMSKLAISLKDRAKDEQ